MDSGLCKLVPRSVDLPAEAAGHLGAGADPELAVGHAQMVLHGTERDVQRGGGLAVGGAAGDEGADVALAGAEPLVARRVLAASPAGCAQLVGRRPSAPGGRVR